MKFQPKTEKEISEQQLLPKGEYDFDVRKAAPAVSGPQSKNPGQEYIKLEVSVWDGQGAHRVVHGMLHPKMDAQLRHFCCAANLMGEYETGSMTADMCVGVTGRLKLKIRQEENGFPAKNEIADFIVLESVTPASATPSAPIANKPESDDVPF